MERDRKESRERRERRERKREMGLEAGSWQVDGDEEGEEWPAVCWGPRMREEVKIGRGGGMQEAKGKFRKNK